MAINQAKMAIPFVVDSSNPSPIKGWSEVHITKTQAWYTSMATWARGHIEREPPTRGASQVSLVEEWDFSNKGLAKVFKAYKVGGVVVMRVHPLECASLHSPTPKLL